MKHPLFKYIIALLLFGLNGIVADNITLESYQIVFLRTLIGSLFLGILFFATKQPITFYKHKKSTLFIIISGIAMGASWICLYEAYAQIGVSVSSLLYYCGPVIVMVLSPILFNEKLTMVKIIGFASVLCGIFLVIGQNTDTLNVRGIFCASLSAVFYSVMVMSNKKAKNITNMENSLIQLIISFLTVAVFAGIKSGFLFSLSKSGLIWVIVLGVVNTGIGCYFYFTSIGSLSVQTVAVCGYLEPLSAVLFSVLLLHETMYPLQAAGAALIIGGAVFGECFCHNSDSTIKEKRCI